MSHLFRQQHLPPHRPSFHRHKENGHYEKPDVAKMKLVNHHGNTGHLLPPVTVSSDDYHGNAEYASTDSGCDDKQLTEDDLQCVNEIRKAHWQPQQLSLVEQQANSNDNRADSVLYEYHLSQPTKVSVDNTTLPTVQHCIANRRKTTSAHMAVQHQHKLPSPPNPILYSNNQDILTTKQLFTKTTALGTATNSIAQHKDRIAQAVESVTTNSYSRNEDTTAAAAANSKVAEIRLVFDNSPPSQQPQHVMGVPAISGHKVDHWNRPSLNVNRPHTTDCGITGRPLLIRKPATRAGIRPIPENAGV